MMVRELIQKGDPMVRVALPEVTVRMLEEAARKNKRRVQDQFIKSLAETFRQEEQFNSVSQQFVADLESLYQGC